MCLFVTPNAATNNLNLNEKKLKWKYPGHHHTGFFQVRENLKLVGNKTCID